MRSRMNGMRMGLAWAMGLLLLDMARAEIVITNVKSGETVGYQLMLLQGTLSAGATEVRIANNGVAIAYPAREGKFKASILLKRGSNAITVSSTTDGTASITIFWNEPDPVVVKKFLRLVWILPSDHAVGDNAKFQAPPFEDNSVESARKRMAVAGLMYQTAYAELMYKGGLGRKTFRLERDSAGEVRTIVHVSKKSMAELHAMKPSNILDYMRISELSAYPNARDATIAMSSSVTRYDGGPVMVGCYNDCPEIKAGEAWGGGGTYAAGWVHSGGMYSWSEDVTQIPRRFMDNRNPKDYGVYPDRPPRGYFWATYATSSGSLFHEIGHGFGTNHNTGPCGVMSQGFHKFNRVFMAEENGKAYASEQICFEPAELMVLKSSPFLVLPEPWNSSHIRVAARPASGSTTGKGPMLHYDSPDAQWTLLGRWRGLAR